MVDIQKIVNLNFKVVEPTRSAAQYKNVLYIKKLSSCTTADAPTVKTDNTYNIFYKLCPNGQVYEWGTTAMDKEFQTKLLDYKKSCFGTDADFISVVIDEAFLGMSSDSKSRTLPAAVTGYVSSVEAPYKLMFFTSLRIATTSATSTNTMAIVKDTLTAWKSLSGAEYIGAMIYKGDTAIIAALELAAYLANIHLDDGNAFADICYTDMSAAKDLFGTTYNLDAAADYDTLIANGNFNDTVTTNYVIFGGNVVSGVPLTVSYGAICAENDTIIAVLKALLRKLPLNDSGLASVVSTINDSMRRYTQNGYLHVGGSYTGETAYSDYAGAQNILLITKGQALSLGYLIATVPMSYLTIDDRKDKRFTPINVFMQTLGGARTITIDGTILS